MIKKLFVFIYCIARVEGLFLFQLKNYLYFYIASIVLFFFFLYKKWAFEIYTNSCVAECFKFEHLKRVKKNIFRTINLCKIKTYTYNYVRKKKHKKDWVLKKLPLLMPRREIDKEEDKTFIYVLF